MHDDEEDEDDGTLKPAWGGAHCSEGVPVPPEFASVKDLGPAIEVIKEMPGIQLFPNFGTPIMHIIARYQGGFAYRVVAMLAHNRRDVHVWRWDEVVDITSNITTHRSSGRGAHLNYEFTLTKNDGEKVMLNDFLEKIGVIGHIKKNVFEILEPQLTTRYENLETLQFGAITVHKNNGLTMNAKSYAWDQIRNVQVKNGRFQIALENEEHEVRVSLIPNIEILSKLIGYNFSESTLYYV